MHTCCWEALQGNRNEKKVLFRLWFSGQFSSGRFQRWFQWKRLINWHTHTHTQEIWSNLFLCHHLLVTISAYQANVWKNTENWTFVSFVFSCTNISSGHFSCAVLHVDSCSMISQTCFCGFFFPSVWLKQLPGETILQPSSSSSSVTRSSTTPSRGAPRWTEPEMTWWVHTTVWTLWAGMLTVIIAVGKIKSQICSPYKQRPHESISFLHLS